MQFNEGKCKILFELLSAQVQDGEQLANSSCTEESLGTEVDEKLNIRELLLHLCAKKSL